MEISLHSPKSLILFDDALQQAIKFAAKNLQGLPTTIIRDVLGRLRIAIDDRATEIPEKEWDHLAADLHLQLGAYSAGESAEEVFLWASKLFAPEALFDASERYEAAEVPGVWILERQVTGNDWLRPQITSADLPRRRRATLFGIKGGVGRSTALAVWARYLAVQLQKRVLVIDLDLESPGVGSLLLPPAQWPRYGLVDYLTEVAVGQGEAVVPYLGSLSPLGEGGQGQVIVVPAYGAEPGDYLAKLSRLYQGVPDGPIDFSARLCGALAVLEARYEPDVVLLDSRAGLHDIAAVTLARLNALALIFAIGTPQTLTAYRLLLSRFRQQPTLLRALRPNLQVVAGMVPETDRTAYLGRLKSNMHRLFAENIYDQDTEPGIDGRTDFSLEDRFNFNLDDEDAPHSPIPIYWYRWFQDFDPVGNPAALSVREIDAAFGVYLQRVSSLLLES